MADRPLKPATHRCLGKPLPYQLANGTQTPPSAHKAFKYTTCVMHCYPVLALLSKSCPRLKGRLSTRYSPVRHFNCSRRNFLVRLACVRHAASVRPEPGSNSQVIILCLITKKLTSIHLFGWIGTGFLSLLIPFSKNLRSTPAKHLMVSLMKFIVNTIYYQQHYYL